MMKVEERMMKNEGGKMKDEGWEGFDNRQTDKQTDICDCRVTFATENLCLFVWCVTCQAAASRLR